MADEIYYPTIVIGAGSGGLTVAIGLAGLGRDVALIERGAVGGDCTNVGCIPSKTLIHLANECDGPGDAAAALATVQRRRDHLRDEETVTVAQTEHLTLLRGSARFVAQKRLELTLADGTRQTLRADNIVIATGSRPRELDIPGLPQRRLLTNESVFEQTTAPAHLAIVGAGVIAVELASAFRKLGSRVTLVALDERPLPTAAPAASALLYESLAEQGVAQHYGTTATGYNELSRTLYLRDGLVEDVDRVMLALGRVRNIDELGLELTGVRFDPRTGIAVDRGCQTNVPGIYAIGDVTPDSFWTHSANAQGRRVVQRIAFPLLPAPSRPPLYPNVTFSDPEVATVGLSAVQIALRYHPRLVTTIRVDLAKTDKGYTDELRRGLIEVYALRLTGRILGATIVAPRASEMISFFTLAISARISLYKLYRLVYPYPTLSGGIQRVADQFMRQTLPHLPAELRDVARYGLVTLWQRLRGGTFAPPAAPAPPVAQAEAVGAR